MHNTHMHGQPDGMAFCKRAEAWLGSRDLSCTWKWYKDILEHLMFSEFWLVERQQHYHFANLNINEIVKWIVVHKSLFSVAEQNDVKNREIEVPLYSHGPYCKQWLNCWNLAEEACLKYQACSRSLVQECRWERLGKAIMICDEYTWSSAGREGSKCGKGWMTAKWTEDHRQRSNIQAAIGGVSPGYKAPLIIKSDRQASGSGRHT